MTGMPTREGKTQEAIHPTSAVVTWTADTNPLNEDTDGTNGWWAAAANQCSPSDTMEGEVLNSFPAKITPSAANDWVTLSDGVWRCTIQFIGKVSGSNADPSLAFAVVDEAETSAYFEIDTGDLLPADATVDTPLNWTSTGILVLPTSANIRLVARNFITTSASITVDNIRMHLERISQVA